MSPEQRYRSRLLKIRNLRRLAQASFKQAFSAAGLRASPVSNERSERLLSALRAAKPVDELQPALDWQAIVRAFAAGRFGLTVAQLWDWEGEVPMFRFAAASISERADCLFDLFSSGFWLADDNDHDLLIVDFDFDDDTRLANARTREIELIYAQNP